LEESDYQSGEYVYQMVEHFVSQCRDTVNPFADVEGVLLDLPSTQTALECAVLRRRIVVYRRVRYLAGPSPLEVGGEVD
jgi:hypothetical protein